MRILIFALMLSLLSPSFAMAAIKFDSMESAWALSDEQKDRVISKLRMIDLEELKDGAAKVKDQLPDGILEKGDDFLKESGIDASGVFSTIFKTFTRVWDWFLELMFGRDLADELQEG